MCLFTKGELVMRKLKQIWHKIKAIPFIGDNYEKLVGQKKIERKMQHQQEEIQNNGVKYLNLVENTMNTSGGLYYAYAVTLLGIVRDKKLIKWDLDIDFAVVITEDFSWSDLQKVMAKSGFRKIREFVFEGLVTEQTYQVDKLTIDFFGQFYDGNKMIQYSYDKLDGVKYSSNSEYSVYLVTLPRVDKTKYIEADGVKVSVPYNAEEILASIYNDDWRIPNPNWKSNSGKCSTLLKDKIAYQVVE